MALGLGGFRTRSPERDNERDAKRLAKLRAAIVNARDDALSEHTGLSRRVNEHFARAAMLLDATGSFAERAPEDEQAIAASEKQALAGQQRLEALTRQIAMLEGLLATLDTGTRPD